MRKYTLRHIKLAISRRISCRLKTFHFVVHDDEINRMARQELQYCRALSIIRHEYGEKLAAMPKQEMNSSQPSRIVWWCWLQGEEQAPPLCKSCLASLRRNLPGFEIRVVTEDNMFEYVYPPQYIIDKLQNGIISRTHFSDILRTLLLVEHGGVWIDSSVYCTGYNIHIFDNPLFVYQNWKFDIEQCMVASSWLMSAQKGHPILLAVRDLLFDYWTNHNALLDYFLFHFFFQMATEKYSDLWNAVPRFSNIPPHILQFEMFEQFVSSRFKEIERMSDFHKLTYKHDLSTKNLAGTFFEQIVENNLK